MAQQTAYLPEILAGIDRQVGAVEAEYKAALAVAAEGLQEAGRRSSDGQGAARGGVLVEEAPPELEPETAMTLHKLETRLDQLKELRDWLKIDPELAGFVAP